MTDEATDRNVFILGAGFSADAGAPVIRDFLDVSREMLDDPDSGLNPEERVLFKKVFDFRKRVAQAREKFEIDLDNIEELFGLVEMSNRLWPDTNATRDATVYLIAKTLELAIARRQGRASVRFVVNQDYRNVDLGWTGLVHPDPSGVGADWRQDVYTYFASMLAGNYDDPKKAVHRSSTVITFNYDLVLDDALRSQDILFHYGLLGEQRDEGIALLKLHGSTNWALCTDCGKPSIRGEKITALYPAIHSMPCGHCGKTNVRLLLVPPSWDKSEYQNVMKPVWAKAVGALQSATRICIIGYSMPESDSFFKYLLTLGLAENHQLYKLIVVDKAPPNFSLKRTLDEEEGKTPEESLEEKYRRMLARLFARKRFYFQDRGFDLFLSEHAQSLLNRAETITFR